MAYHRVSRAVRLCMALSAKFHTDRLEREKHGAVLQATAERQRKVRLKTQLKRLVEQAIEHQADQARESLIESETGDPAELGDEPSPNDRRYLYDATRERLEEDDIERDLGQRPMGELVGRICRDIEIKPDWDYWAQDFWALEEARLKPPGSPYAERPERKPPEPEPAEARPPESEPPEPEQEDAKPAAPAAAPARRYDGTRVPTLEQQRADQEHRARIRAKYYNGL
jgi:hypothetical protein